MRERKNSGIEWIGKIIKTWNILKGKYVLNYLQRPVKISDEVVTCFRDGEVTLRSNRRTEGFTVSDKEIGYQGIEKGDLVVHGMDGFAGAIGISDSRGKGSPILNVLNSSQNKKYLMYYLRTLAYENVFLGLSTGIRVRSCDLRWNKLANLNFVIPSKIEQQQIVDFLDQKCSEIDSLSADIQKQIDILEKYKKSVITEAVTKGLNPNVEMKDSGIEWIGRIPKHWGTTKIKYTSWLKGRIGWQGLKSSEYIEKGAYLITGTDFIDGKINWNSCVHISELRFNQDHSIHVKENDLLISKDGTIGKVAIASNCPEKVSLNSGILLIRSLNKTYTSKYLYYLLLSNVFLAWYDSNQTGNSTIKHLYQEQFYNFSFSIPKLQEQHNITDFLDKQCAEIDKTIKEKQKQLEILAEYKKSVIYEYVTGKKEVPAA